jgi:hypothetical protein
MRTKLGNWGSVSKKWGPNEFLKGTGLPKNIALFLMFEGFSMGENWGPDSFDPEFWSKIEFDTCSTPLYFFHA